MGKPGFFLTECEVCGREFETENEDDDLCWICEIDEQTQMEMDRDRE